MNALSGAIRISIERQRQKTQEGYTAEHDAGQGAALVRAAAAYALFSITGIEHALTPTDALAEPGGRTPPPVWPWEAEAWRPTGDAEADLVKAGALIAAAIDALHVETQA